MKQERKSQSTTLIIDKLKDAKQLVSIAIGSNFIMFVAKSYGAYSSGSASMFAESMHSLADSI
jgi:divalent metal cation (Fe/Co/Zn/Cd) transporter